MADTYWAERERARWDVYSKQRGWMAQADTEDDARLIVAGLEALQAPPAAAVPEVLVRAYFHRFSEVEDDYTIYHTLDGVCEQCIPVLILRDTAEKGVKS